MDCPDTLAGLVDMSCPTCGWFLVGITGCEITHRDGCHGDIEGVQEALYLHQHLHLSSPPDKWVAVYITEIEPSGEEINHEAIEICNEMLDHYRVTK